MKFPTNSFEFLQQLIQNNDRDWFTERKPEFKRLKEINKQFFQSIYADLQAVDELENCKVFRIYRDVRFSKDKTPYKSHYAARYVRQGNRRRGTYYLHIEPNNQSFCAGGFYGPNKEDLLRIRKEFEYDDAEIRTILSDKTVASHFPNGLEGEELKTSPRGFSIEHKAIDLIRKKQFYLSAKFTDKDVLQEDFSLQVVEKFRAMLPYLNYMSEVVTTNLNGEVIV